MNFYMHSKFTNEVGIHSIEQKPIQRLGCLLPGVLLCLINLCLNSVGDHMVKLLMKFNQGLLQHQICEHH